MLTVKGSRRPSVASVHSSASSLRSFSAKRYERENEMRLAAAAAKAREASARAVSPRSADPLLSLANGNHGQSEDELKPAADWTSKSSELLLVKDEDEGGGAKPSETPITQNLFSSSSSSSSRPANASTAGPMATIPPLYENPLALLPNSTSGSKSTSGEWDAPPPKSQT